MGLASEAEGCCCLGWLAECCFSGLPLLAPKQTRVKSMIRESVLSRMNSGGQGIVDIHTLLLCPDPARHVGSTYATIGTLGKGAFGSVFRVRHKPTGEERAIKVVRKPRSAHDLDRVLTEVAILISLDHPNIMKFHEYYEDPTYICLVTELCTGGNIGELNTIDNSQEEIRILFRDIMAAVAYCHSMGVAHRDLKFDNCLLTLEDSCRRAFAKLIDFGLSSFRRAGDEESHWMSDAVGTICFIAPEVLNSDDNYGPECDLWSVGVMLFIVLTDEHPFVQAAQPSRIIRDRILKAPLRLAPLDKACAEPAAREILGKLLEKDPSQRLDAQGALEHRYFSECPHSCQRWPSSKGTPKVSTPCVKHLLSRSRSFAGFTRLERAILTLVAHEVHARDVDDLRAAFVSLDANRAGYLSRKSFCAAVQARGIKLTEAEMETTLRALDPDGDDMIQYTDWLAATLKPSAITSDTALEELFNFFDIHGAGAVSQQDFREILGEDVAAEVLPAGAAAGEAGPLSREDFRVMMFRVARNLEEAGRRRRGA